MTREWDFYLTDNKQQEYLCFELQSFRENRFAPIIADGCINPSLTFVYEVQRKALLTEPKKKAFTFSDFFMLFYNEKTSRELFCDSIKLQYANSADYVSFNAQSEVEELLHNLTSQPGRLEMQYSSNVSISEPMNYLIYWIQLENNAVQNIFLENPITLDSLYWLKYSEQEQKLKFHVNKEKCISPYNDEELKQIGSELKHKWYEFGYFDYVRAVSKWAKFENFISYFNNVQITIKYISGETEVFPIQDIKQYKLFLKKVGKDKANILEAYIANITKDKINGFTSYKYSDTYKRFDLQVPENQFWEGYKHILGIVDTCQI